MKRFCFSHLSVIKRSMFHQALAIDNTNIPLRHVDVIKNFTGCPVDKVVKAVSSKLELQFLDEKDLVFKLKLLEKLEVYDLKSLNILPLLLKHPSNLKNKHTALCEYGFNSYLISAFHIKRFCSICKKSVKELKEKGFIDKNIDVLKNLWEHASLDSSSCPETSEDESLYSLKAITLKAFFKEKFNISDFDFKKQESDIHRRLLNKSLKNITTNFRIFSETIQLSRQRLFSNWYVLYVDSDNIEAILNKHPTIGSTDIKVCLNVYPKIVSMPVENLEKMIYYLQEGGVPIKALEQFPNLLTLSCETVKKRLDDLRSNEVLSIYHKHPAVAKLLHYQVKAKRRLNVFQDMKIFYTMNYLLTTEKEFQRVCEFGCTRTSGYESLQFLKSELNLEKEELVDKLNKHKRWKYVPLIDVAKNLQYLRKIVTDEEIKRNIYILFYYHGRLLEGMEKLEHYEFDTFESSFKWRGQINKDYILPLVIYFLEKDSNFSGESIWESCATDPYQDLPDYYEDKDAMKNI